MFLSLPPFLSPFLHHYPLPLSPSPFLSLPPSIHSPSSPPLLISQSPSRHLLFYFHSSLFHFFTLQTSLSPSLSPYPLPMSTILSFYPFPHPSPPSILPPSFDPFYPSPILRPLPPFLPPAVSSGGTKARKVEVGGLVPATHYTLRVTAVSSAGSTTHAYSFTTLTHAGGKWIGWSG